MKTLLAVSPHLDDAVFSAGGFLWTVARASWRVVIATVFTGNADRPSGFALACQLNKGLPADVDYMALRRAEDVEACGLLGAEYRHLPLLEAPHRGYDNAPALFGSRLRADNVLGPASQAIADLIRELRPDCILGPLAIGNHVDHHLVREVLTSANACNRLWSWEDWPYLDRVEPPARATATGCALSDASRAAKLQACLAYASQLGYQFGGPERLATVLQSQQAEWFHPQGGGASPGPLLSQPLSI